MLLDSSTRRNLELTETLREKSKKRGSLFGFWTRRKTAMVPHDAQRWIEQPLIAKKEMNLRLDAVDELLKTNVPRRNPRIFKRGLRSGTPAG